jgi:inhibitor of cysteine peptidase
MFIAKRGMLAVGIITLLAFALLGCGPVAQPSPTPEPGTGNGDVIRGEPMVESVDVQILESFPVQVQAVVRGNLADGCTALDEVTTTREGNLFRIRLTSVRPADAVCTLALVPFEEVVSLDVLGLPAGEYTVDANGVTATFTLAMDNVLPEATP